MKIVLSLSILSALFFLGTNASEPVTWTCAKKNQDLIEFKKVYLAIYGFLLKDILTNGQLSERFDSLASYIGKDDFNFILFNKGKQALGFLPFFKETINNKSAAVIHDTPIILTEARAVNELFPSIIDYFKVQEGYCFVGKGAEKVEEMVLKMGYKKESNTEVPRHDIKWNPEHYNTYSQSFSIN